MKTEKTVAIGDTVYTVLSSYTTIGLMMIRGGVRHPEWVPDDLVETGHAMIIETWERPGAPGTWMRALHTAMQLLHDLVEDHPETVALKLKGRDRALEDEEEYRVGIEAEISSEVERYDTAQALYSAADDGGTIQAADMVRVAGAESPDLHTTMTISAAAEAMGCLAELREIIGDPDFGYDGYYTITSRTVRL